MPVLFKMFYRVCIVHNVLPCLWLFKMSYRDCIAENVLPCLCCSKCPTVSRSSEPVGASWLIAFRRSDWSWLLLFAVSLAMSILQQLSLSLLVLQHDSLCQWGMSAHGFGFGDCHQPTWGSSSVVTANQSWGAVWVEVAVLGFPS